MLTTATTVQTTSTAGTIATDSTPSAIATAGGATAPTPDRELPLITWECVMPITTIIAKTLPLSTVAKTVPEI